MVSKTSVVGSAHSAKASRRAAATTHNALRSIFFRFPGEVRNMIYFYFLSQQIYNFKRKNTNKKNFRIRLQPAFRGKTPHRDALLLTCQQIYFEARELALPNATFCFTSLTAFCRVESKFFADRRVLMTKLHLQSRDMDRIYLDTLLMYFYRTKFAELLPNAVEVLLDVYPDPSPPLHFFTRMPIGIDYEYLVENVESWITEKGNVKFVVRFLDPRGRLIKDAEWRGHTLW